MPLTENNILFYWTAPEGVAFRGVFGFDHIVDHRTALEYTETVETRVLKSSFSGIKGAKKERKMLEKSSNSPLGSRRREFESPHSDHIGT